MHIQIKRIGIVSSIVMLSFFGSSAVFALPTEASVKAQASVNSNTSSTQVSTSTQMSSSSASTTGKANGQAKLATAQLRACQNRESAINNIMTRIDTRATNQLNLFSTIASRVEAFYTSKSKTVSNYAQLVATINALGVKANADLLVVKSSSTLSCSASNPKGMVEAFQSYLKTEITDLQNYRTAVKNLIVAVATANGVKVSSSTQTSTTQGGN